MSDRNLRKWSDHTFLGDVWPYAALAVGVGIIALGGMLFSHLVR